MSMSFRSRWVQRMAVVLTVAAAWGSQGNRALAVRGGETVQFGPIGVAPDEAVRLNVYAATPGGISDPDNAQWDFVVRIFNKRGDLTQEQRLRLAPGVTGSVDVNIGNPDIFPVERLGRRTLRAEIVAFNPQPDPPGAKAELHAGSPQELVGDAPHPLNQMNRRVPKGLCGSVEFVEALALADPGSPRSRRVTIVGSLYGRRGSRISRQVWEPSRPR
jgi:hypothetical protein